jgi:hypothetical protein
LEKLVRHELRGLSSVNTARIASELTYFTGKQNLLVFAAIAFYYGLVVLFAFSRLPLVILEKVPGLAQARRLVRTKILLTPTFILWLQEVHGGRRI